MTASVGYGAQSGAGDRRPPVRQVAADIWARSRSADVRPAAAWVLTLILLFIYAGLQPGTLSTSSLGILAADTLALATLGLGQGVVILTAGIDLSVGGVLSLGTTIAATHFTGTGTTLLWSVVILAIGTGRRPDQRRAGRAARAAAVHRHAGHLVDLRRHRAVRAADGGRPGPGRLLGLDQRRGGRHPECDLGPDRAWWPSGCGSGGPGSARRIYAVGSDREAARIAGVRIAPTLMTAYAISGLCAGGAALFYAMLTASGDPTSGDGLILPSVAAVVIGGTSLFGGQGGFVGTVAGALTLTLLGDVIFAVNLPSYWTVLADGLLLIVAVLAGTGLQALQARRAGGGA